MPPPLRPLLVIVLVAVLLSATAPAPRAATAPPTGVVLAAGLAKPAVTDGHGIVAWVATPGTIHVLDLPTGRTFDVNVSGDCLTPPAGIVAAGGGKLLYSCTRPPDAGSSYGLAEPRVLDVATATIQVPVGGAELLRQALGEALGEGHFDGVGAYGLLLNGSCYHCSGYTTLLDATTGQRIGGNGTAKTLPDLNRPGLLTTLCAPLTRTGFGDRDADIPFEFDSYAYEPPYGVTFSDRASLTIQRCASATKLVLEPLRRGQPGPQDVNLSAGFVTWKVRDVGRAPLYAFLPECDAMLSWPSVSPLVEARHVEGGIVLSETFRGGGSWRVRQLSLEGVCARATKGLSARVAAGRSAVAPVLRSGWLPDGPTGALATLHGPSRAAPRLAVRGRQPVRLTLPTAARAVRWRVGAGAWHRAAGGGRRWSARIPPFHGSRVLAFDVRAAGGSIRFGLRVVQRGR